MKSRFRQGLGYILAVGSMGLVLSGCGSGGTHAVNSSANSNEASSSTQQAPVEGGSIQLDLSKNVKTIDPAIAYDTASDQLVEAMYNPLVTYKGSSNKIVGDVAKKWNISTDGKIYTFHLRKGITFWNGDPVTADSYIAEFKRILTKKLGSPGSSFLQPIVVGSTAFYDNKAKTITGVTAPNKYTLKIQLTKVEPFFLQVMAMHFFMAVDPAWIKKVGNAAFGTSQPMGSGPFKLAQTGGTTYVLRKNPNYFMKDSHGNRLPYLNKITMTYNKNTQLDAMDFEKGVTAFLGTNTRGIPDTAYAKFMSDPKLKKDIMTAPEGSVHYIGLNVTVKPFTNRKVRQAVEYAVDKKAIIKLLGNKYIKANQPVPPGVFGRVNQLPASVNYNYNPSKAKSLLKQAGVKLPLHTTFDCSNDPATKKVATEIQSNLQAVGIDVKIDSMPWSTFLTTNGKGTQPIFLLDWIQDFPDASDFLNTLFNTSEEPVNNSTMYSNKQVDKWLNKAQTDPNQAQRKKLYREATIQIMKDATWVPLYYGKYIYAIQPWLHGYYINPNLDAPLAHIWTTKS